MMMTYSTVLVIINYMHAQVNSWLLQLDSDIADNCDLTSSTHCTCITNY